MFFHAKRYLTAGLCALPAVQKKKRPTTNWKRYQHKLPRQAELAGLFHAGDAVCIVCGAVSGGLEMIDFDSEAEAFPAWREKIPQEIFNKLVLERSQSSGLHAVYRAGNIEGSQKLATQNVQCASGEPLTVKGKIFTPTKKGGQWFYIKTLIETRGEGGLFLCAPTRGYTVEQGSLEAVQTLSEAERDTLINAARSLGEAEIPVAPNAPHPMVPAERSMPGDDYNERGDLNELLAQHGWAFVSMDGDNARWRRPGKRSGHSATVKDRVFYPFTSSTAFDPNRGYSPFAVYATLEHAGDYPAAAATLAAQGYGAVQVNEDSGIDWNALRKKPEPKIDAKKNFHVPGFIQMMMDRTMATAPYPNEALAFVGAATMLGFLTGRKVADAGDNRTNFFMIGLANSGAGKDHPRKANVLLAHELGLTNLIGDRFASAEGLQDQMLNHPVMFYQTDEIDTMLQSISTAREARYEAILSMLLTLYSSASSIQPMRAKAGKISDAAIIQPHLMLFGTAIPHHFYSALNQRMLTNGFFSRTIIIEAGKRATGQEAAKPSPTEAIIETAKAWVEFQPGGNLGTAGTPTPAVVPANDAAVGIQRDTRVEADGEYAKSERAGDPVGMAVWSRANEQARKLALLYAVSEYGPDMAAIGKKAASWGREFAFAQCRQMLDMAAGRVSDNAHHALCLRLLETLGTATVPHSHLLRAMRMSSRDFTELTRTMTETKQIVTLQKTTGGRPSLAYRAGKKKESSCEK